MRRGAWVLPALAAAFASGCVYYNGMYNANRAAKEAQRLERQGRPGEARDRWQRAAIHAESLVARHPRSRWADDALLIRGRALLQMEYATDAVVVLEQAVRAAQTEANRAEALTLLGRANLGIGRPATARAVLDTAVAIGRAPWRSEAALLRGRALLALGQPVLALEDFAATSDPRARFDVVRAHLAMGDAAAAGERLTVLLGDRPYVEREWRGPLDSLARAGGAETAARLVAALAARADLTRGQRARLFLDDADRRLAAGDTARAREGYAAAAAASPDSADGRMGAVRSLRLALTAATSDSALAAAGERLAILASDGGTPGREAEAVLQVLARLDSLANAAEAPDAHWFLRAELLRDELHAGPLAARAFAEMATRFAASPWTPKALVAAIAAGAPQPDALRAVLDARYAASPYRLAAIGLAGDPAGAEAFRVLEDSLGRILAQAQEQRRPAARRAVRDAEVDREDAPRPARPPAPRPTSPAIPPPAGTTRR